MIRPAAIVALCLALVLSSWTMAVARGHAAAPGSQMVICTGYGLVTVTLDAEGNPTGPVLPCPDCVVTLAALPAGPVMLPVPALRRARPGRRPSPALRAGRPRRGRRARGPPGGA